MQRTPKHMRWLKEMNHRFSIFTHHFARTIRGALVAVNALSLVASVSCLTILVLLVGFDHSQLDIRLFDRILRGCRVIFIVVVLYHDLFARVISSAQRGKLRWMTTFFVLSTAIPLLYPQPAHPWLPWLAQIVYNKIYISAVMAAFAVFEISRNIMQLVSRRLNPSLLLTISFLMFILLGSLALMLPKCTVTPISYIDSLFLATSTVCITGLTPVDIPSVFTPTGLAVLAVLIQIGGIGVLTFTSFFALFFSGASSVYNQLLIRDMVYSKTMNSLIPTLVYIIGFTLSVEAIGAVAIFFTIPDGMLPDIREKLVFAGFHSLSSFCNAGFSCLPGGMSNPALMTPVQGLYNVTSCLIFAGAVGFPILVNFKDILFHRISRLWDRLRGRRPRVAVHLFDLNTKLVLSTTLTILIIGTAAFFALEYGNTLRGMTLWQKISQSLFNALIPRSAGFASVNPADFLPVTLMFVVIQMWIGGASQSLAGGIKVNTFAVVMLNIKAVLSGGSRAMAYGRSISIGSVRRANTVLVLAVISYFVFLTAVMLMDTGLGLRNLMFETTSALFTVGSSLGITPLLSPGSKVVLSIAMLVGRVGIISLLTGFIGRHYDTAAHLPQENIIIS